jgi:HK97 family phage major capsid protein
MLENKFNLKYRKLLKEMRDIADTAMAEDRDFTEAEKTRLNNMSEEAKKLKASAETVNQLFSLDEEISMDEPRSGKKEFKGDVGRQLTESEQYKRWFNSIAMNGRIPDSYKGIRSPSFEVDSFKVLNKAPLQGGAEAYGGAFVTPDDTGIYEPLGRYPTVVQNLISIRQTDSDTVEFVRQLTQLDAAANVAESQTTDGPTANITTGELEYPTNGGYKPLGDFTFERVSQTVKTMAVAVGATKRSLSDAAQLRGIINQELREDLADHLESQIFTGDGTGENLTGIKNTSGILTQAFATDILTTTRQAITNLATNGKQRPTAWVFHPSDWEAIELLKDSNGQYYYGGPIGRGTPRLWGVPVVESYHISAGIAYLANWRKAVLWDREQDSISMTDSHSDWFLRNMVAILAEKRVAFGLIRPSAFVEVALSV